MNRSFEKGWYQLRAMDQPQVRAEIMCFFKQKTIQAFINRRKGMCELNEREREFIEQIFAKYGITDIWGYYDKR